MNQKYTKDGYLKLSWWTSLRSRLYARKLKKQGRTRSNFGEAQ